MHCAQNFENDVDLDQLESDEAQKLFPFELVLFRARPICVSIGLAQIVLF